MVSCLINFHKLRSYRSFSEKITFFLNLPSKVNTLSKNSSSLEKCPSLEIGLGTVSEFSGDLLSKQFSGDSLYRPNSLAGIAIPAKQFSGDHYPFQIV